MNLIVYIQRILEDQNLAGSVHLYTTTRLYHQETGRKSKKIEVSWYYWFCYFQISQPTPTNVKVFQFNNKFKHSHVASIFCLF